MSKRIHFSGPALYRSRSLAILIRTAVDVSVRRKLKGPRRPGWNWVVEFGTEALRRQLVAAFRMKDVNKARRYLDSVVLDPPALAQVNITPVLNETFSGSWFIPKDSDSPLTLLYFHGGGYSFYPKAYLGVVALITMAAKSRTFALDYPLTPEHRFPAQLTKAVDAYRWLLDSGTDPAQLVVGGDSAGANLALALLLKARDLKLPLPALAVCLSPPTDFDPGEQFESGHAIAVNQEFDWIGKDMLIYWSDWFCDPAQRRDPLVSPLYADLTGLPPIYIQAGRAEILYESIEKFAAHARSEGADVTLESWDDMNHVFQAFGYDAPQSTEALQRIGQIIETRIRALQQGTTV